jgi:predicted nucleotidyltransferase
VPDASGESSLVRFVAHFQRYGVEFLVIGGQAEAIFGSPRVTYDVDLCYRRTPENLQRLAEALRPLRVRLRNAPPDLPFRIDARSLALGCNFTLETDIDHLDLIGWVEPIGDYDALLRNAETWEVGGYQVKTIGLEDLIRVKEQIARRKDSESLWQLRAILGLRKEKQASDG